MNKINIKKFYNFLRYRRDFTRYSLKKARSYEILLFWLKSVMNRTQFLILSGMLVGITCGLAGVLLKELVHYIHYIITYKVHFERQILFYLLFPFLGIVITTLVVIFVFKGQDRKGIAAILYEIAQNSSIVSSVKMYSQIVQSAITVGLGGSAGLESPIAVTGAAIGSNFARTYKLDYRERTLLLAAGATAGIASAFNAPIAGMMFAFEILLTGVVFSDFIPLVLAAVCGSLVSKILLEEEVLFQFKTRNAFDYHNIPYYLALGILCGLYARYYVLIAKAMDHFFQNLKMSRIKKAMLGGAILSVLCVLYPPLFGEGYDTIKAITNGQMHEVMQNSLFRFIGYREWVILVFVAVICLLKAFSASITIFSGGNGGNFAPSLFAGGSLGYVFALLCVQLGMTEVPTNNLVIVGMAGVMSGVLYAPLTAIFLIAESTSGYDLFIPLMVVSVISFSMAKWFSSVSPDLEKLADQGKIFTREHDRNLLSLLQILDLIDKDVQVIRRDASPEELAEVVRTGHRNMISVIDSGKRLAGIISLDDIRPLFFNPEAADMLEVESLMKVPAAVISDFDSVVSVVKKFDETGAWNLPVVKANGEFLGFISKSSVLNSYRQLLRAHSG
ncbi:Voltage-gated ClC-type chloride channel ClcB [Dyadobacter sp. CECT 9623]|uniref:Voltage-gated ClC-type chloride channel ClcB n=1 Tax=Dyadobacter linearis TaxID=2823330 RepID=A0ABM8UP07_9BACT|nr:chloride channel protein [Dyadobacter sp. CECT 9623]CAG5069192.1 Voltage-gated ClC-type chloride channel ClcB [Dyadobacter sp. CECT 9623]